MMSICFVGVSFLFIITVVIFVLYMYMYCFCALVPTPQLTHPVVIFFMKHKRKFQVDTDLYKLIMSPQYLT